MVVWRTSQVSATNNDKYHSVILLIIDWHYITDCVGTLTLKIVSFDGCLAGWRLWLFRAADYHGDDWPLFDIILWMGSYIIIRNLMIDHMAGLGQVSFQYNGACRQQDNM